MERVTGSHGRRFRLKSDVSYCNSLLLGEIVQEGVNKPNHPIQTPYYCSSSHRLVTICTPPGCSGYCTAPF
jgi:hypothetical protein